MKTLKKVLGVFLIALPFIGLAALSINDGTLIEFMIAMMVTIIIASVVTLGVVLLYGDD
jgi:hypothetical protein